MRIKTPPPSPLALEYLAKKKLEAQSKKSQDHRSNTSQADTVTLSGQEDSANAAVKPKPSKPVSIEELQSLNSTFSVKA
jgi:hypothetical protein